MEFITFIFRAYPGQAVTSVPLEPPGLGQYGGIVHCRFLQGRFAQDEEGGAGLRINLIATDRHWHLFVVAADLIVAHCFLRKTLSVKPRGYFFYVYNQTKAPSWEI